MRMMNMSLATDVAQGSRSVQNFSNAAFTCSDEDAFSTPAASPAAAAPHERKKSNGPHLHVALAGAVLTLIVIEDAVGP